MCSFQGFRFLSPSLLYFVIPGHSRPHLYEPFRESESLLLWADNPGLKLSEEVISLFSTRALTLIAPPLHVQPDKPPSHVIFSGRGLSPGVGLRKLTSSYDCVVYLFDISLSDWGISSSTWSYIQRITTNSIVKIRWRYFWCLLSRPSTECNGVGGLFPKVAIKRGQSGPRRDSREYGICQWLHVDYCRLDKIKITCDFRRVISVFYFYLPLPPRRLSPTRFSSLSSPCLSIPLLGYIVRAEF